MCDGSVQIISYSVDTRIHYRLSNRRDGQNVPQWQATTYNKSPKNAPDKSRNSSRSA
jgi:hypothetical protein